jgi:predicted nucleic acid-binding protein
MVLPLDSVPNGSDVLIDANVFVYAISNTSTQCKDFLERCSREHVYGITLFEVVHEATHEFMRAEAKAKGLFTATEKGVKYLSKHPEQVKGLSDYWVNTQKVLALNLVLLPCEDNIVVGAQKERVDAGLLTNDSVIVAAMREYGISKIATRDAIFDSVTGLSVFSPTDV